MDVTKVASSLPALVILTQEQLGKLQEQDVYVDDRDSDSHFYFIKNRIGELILIGKGRAEFNCLAKDHKIIDLE